MSLLDPMPFPQSAWAAKRGDTGFGGDARAGEDDDVADGSHGLPIGKRRNVWKGWLAAVPWFAKRGILFRRRLRAIAPAESKRW